MSETFGPELVRPAQKECPACGCCSAQLCERGRDSVMECVGLTPTVDRHVVQGCPCSGEMTRGTAAWRAGRIRSTLQALVMPLAPEVERELRVVASGLAAGSAYGLAPQLLACRYIADGGERPVVTELGRAYLAARDEPRTTTAVHVELVDVRARTARVIVVGWSLDEAVTVLMDQLTAATGLRPAELPGRFLEAEANCETAAADDVVLSAVRMAPALVQSWGSPWQGGGQ